MKEEKWKKTHLADLHRLARVDGQATPSEFLAIFEVEDRLEVGIVHCSEALRVSRADPAISGGTGDPVTDLELLTDLYTIGFADGKLDSREQLLIREFRECTDLMESENAAAFEAGREQALELIEDLVESKCEDLVRDESVQGRLEDRRRHFANLFRVALADGGLSGRELLVLLDTERAWYLPGSDFVDSFNRAERDPDPDPLTTTLVEDRRMAMDLFAVAASDANPGDPQISTEEQEMLHGILCPIHAPHLIERIRRMSSEEAEKRVLHAIKIYGPKDR